LACCGRASIVAHRRRFRVDIDLTNSVGTQQFMKVFLKMRARQM
jgi:hypothetical protein